MRPYNPVKRFGLLRVRSPLLSESQLISFPGLLRWFSSPSMTLATYFIQSSKYTKFIRVGYPIRKSRYHRIFASPPSLSQLITSFIALQLLGIRHKPIIHLTILLFPQTILSRTIQSNRLHNLQFYNYSILNLSNIKKPEIWQERERKKERCQHSCVHIHFPVKWDYLLSYKRR